MLSTPRRACGTGAGCSAERSPLPPPGSSATSGTCKLLHLNTFPARKHPETREPRARASAPKARSLRVDFATLACGRARRAGGSWRRAVVYDGCCSRRHGAAAADQDTQQEAAGAGGHQSCESLFASAEGCRCGCRLCPDQNPTEAPPPPPLPTGIPHALPPSSPPRFPRPHRSSEWHDFLGPWH